MNIRLAGAYQHVHAVLADDLARQRIQMLVVEFAIELRASINYAPIDGRTHDDAPGPVLGGERQLQRADVHVAHRDQPSLLDRSAACLAVLESYVSKQHTAPQIELLAV